MRPKRDGPAEAGPPGHAEKTSRLPLGELEPLARSGPSVLLPLHRARIAREEARLLQWRPELRVELGERTADPVPDGASLPREPAAADDHGDVHLVELLDDLERLLEDHLAGLAPEVLVEGAVVDDEFARAGLHPHPRDRLLAPPGSGNDQVLGHLSRILMRSPLPWRRASGRRGGACRPRRSSASSSARGRVRCAAACGGRRPRRGGSARAAGPAPRRTRRGRPGTWCGGCTSCRATSCP